MNRFFRSSWLAAVFLVSFFLAGCAAGGAKIKGRLVVNGQPYPVPAGEEVQIRFASDKMALAVNANADGTFTVTGPGESGLPPGLYQIRLTGLSSRANPSPDGQSKVAGASSGEQPWLRYEVTSEPEQKIVIDLGTQRIVKE